MVRGGAEIQPDNNWAKVHNSILELLASSNFSARELRCLLYLLRRTYGDFGKKENEISLSEWAKGTNLKRGHVASTLAGLVSRNVIVKTQTGARSTTVWAFNKYFENWLPSTPVGTTFTGTPVGTTSSTHEGTTPSTPVGTSGSTPVHEDNSPIKKEDTTKKEEAAAVFQCWSENMPGMLSSILADDLSDLTNTYGAEPVIRAIGESVRYNVRNIRYVTKVLENWAAGKTLKPSTVAPTNPVASGFALSDVMGD